MLSQQRVSECWLHICGVRLELGGLLVSTCEEPVYRTMGKGKQNHPSCIIGALTVGFRLRIFLQCWERLQRRWTSTEKRNRRSFCEHFTSSLRVKFLNMRYKVLIANGIY